MKDVGLLALRVVGGGLLAGHGAQKLFGAFEGPGLKGTAGHMEMMGLAPGHYWGTAAALSEFGGGSLLALGLLTPLGSIGAISAMTMATAKAHWGKPIWVSKGGAELAVTNGAIALALASIGPGAYSLDHALGIKVPKPIVAAAALTAAALVAYGITRQPAPAPAPAEPPRTTAQAAESTDSAEDAVEAGKDTVTATADQVGVA